MSPSSLIGAGTAVMAGAIVGTEARLGLGEIVNCGAVVDHSTVEDYGHLGVNASMAGGTLLGRSAWVQAGAALGYGVTVPSGLTLAPGDALDSKSNKFKMTNDSNSDFGTRDSGLLRGFTSWVKS